MQQYQLGSDLSLSYDYITWVRILYKTAMFERLSYATKRFFGNKKNSPLFFATLMFAQDFRIK